MQICGFNKTTLLDYPGHVAATVFTGCCNFRCPFCQNGDLVLHPGRLSQITEDEVLRVLEKRKGILTGVCITGGEPTLQPDLPAFLKKVKDLGLLVKLDTNGYLPKVIESLFSEGLLDYIAMDIKSSPEHYAAAAGFPGLQINRIFQSVSFILSCGLPYEFRTTVVRELHHAEDFRSIGRWLQGAQSYFLQSYQESDGVISPIFSAYTKEELEGFQNLLLPFIPNTCLRGVD
ncbi:MAG TPA: anaerobic ribonucleoside-triphosphate reductase activating protein [Candidatus Eisenbergiella merdipullorum]|uniref:Anaerobic ribonucleoside-triphosphate reductase activating protein n=1 Tax=Candidatus Eisenbergiella merdipullorum TaxID=2838553 RepID=A0A9D2L0K0_9FIRM|nr:anaerobic ribonucleoside-triphosphate reductase activating protein [Candidatus Eisenbergiella merdipullorum]